MVSVHLGLLSAACSRYVIPDISALNDYLEIFESSAVSGFIILQSVVSGVSAVSMATIGSGTLTR